MTHKVTANCTNQKSQGTTCTHFSAYRLHADDPIIFHDGFVETWRNGDPEGCSMKYGSADGAALAAAGIADNGAAAGSAAAAGVMAGGGQVAATSLGTPTLNASSLTLVYEWEPEREVV
jgi:hypothetical protein